HGKSVKKLDIKDKKSAATITKALKDANYVVESVTKKQKKKNAPPPFKTSTLQQAAGQKLGFSAKQTMRLAQQLYEGIDVGEGQVGLITYMRTDSLNLAADAVHEARKFIENEYGKDFIPEEAPAFKTKSKGAQEAHEAIRPSSASRSPESIQKYLTPQQYRLYNLIWSRMVASQMNPAIFNATTADISAADYTFRATGSVITFDGYLKVYQEVGAKKEDEILPPLEEKDECNLNELRSEQHFTQPPARYSDATLVKKLEELGIGRPSTYAPIISTIQDRGYVIKEEKKLQPTDIGTLVNKVLVEHFTQIVNYEFTADLEKELDDIANGKQQWVPVVEKFYGPFKDNLKKKDKELSKKELTEEASDEVCPKCGKPMVIKMGRFGKFLACTGYPDCKTTKPLADEEAAIPDEYKDKKCPKCGKPMAVKFGRFGKFLGCSDYPDCKTIEPIEKKTGVTCPKCEKGDIIEKRSRRGRTFYACNRYPKCEQSYWQKPTEQKCPDCDSLLAFAAKGKLRCSSKECKYETEQED
ncbi:type I DNA topoisomerase, partial [Patescibacteria group bacterium]